MTKNVLFGLLLINSVFAHDRVIAAEPPINLYTLDSTWHNATEGVENLAGFKGKKVVFAMFYASCQSSCPLIVKKMQKIEAVLKAKHIAAEFVIVSIDFEHDQAKALTQFREHMGLKDSYWHTLHGTEQATRRLANYLEIKFSRPTPNNDIMHDNKILLFDEHGALVRVIEGVGGDIAELF